MLKIRNLRDFENARKEKVLTHVDVGQVYEKAGKYYVTVAGRDNEILFLELTKEGIKLRGDFPRLWSSTERLIGNLAGFTLVGLYDGEYFVV